MLYQSSFGCSLLVSVVIQDTVLQVDSHEQMCIAWIRFWVKSLGVDPSLVSSNRPTQ